MIIPEMILPNIFAMPTMEINMAACEVGRFFETPRSGIKVSGTDCTETNSQEIRGGMIKKMMPIKGQLANLNLLQTMSTMMPRGLHWHFV